MTSGDQNDVLHLLNSQSKLSGESEPAVDMFDHPLAKISAREGVLT